MTIKTEREGGQETDWVYSFNALAWSLGPGALDILAVPVNVQSKAKMTLYLCHDPENRMSWKHCK